MNLIFFKKFTLRRVIFFLILLILGTSVLITDNIFIRIAVVLIIIIVISFLIFAREVSPETKQDKLSTEGKSSDKEESAEKISGPENKESDILTSEDLKKLDKKILVHDLIPSNMREKFFELACEKLPKEIGQDEQFRFLLNKILSLINTTLMANSTSYFWYNSSRNQLLLESSYPEGSVIHKSRFELSDDIVSKVIRNNSPEIVNNINSNIETDVIRYYTQPIGVKSVVAVPVYFNEEAVGALVVDSKSDDVFGYETVYLLGRYVRMISLIFKVFDEKYTEFLVKQKLEAIAELIFDAESYKTETVLINKFLSVADKMIEFDACAVVLADYLEKNFKIFKVLNKTSLKYAGENLVIDYENSLVGTTIQQAQSLIIEDITEIKKPIYSESEPGNFAGSVLIIPLVFGNYILGAIVFENLRKNYYTPKNKAEAIFLTKVVKFISYSLENIRITNIVNSQLSKDLETSFLNKTEFERRLSEEFSKAQESKANIGLALISIDRFDQLVSEYNQKIIPEVIRYLSGFLKKEAEKLMLLARLEVNKFGVIFYNIDDQSAFIWCEKIRQKILREPLRLGESGKLISITLSIGYAGGKGLKSEFHLLENSEKALKRATETGNNVKTTK